MLDRLAQMPRKCPYCGKELKGNEYGAHFKNNAQCLVAKKENRVKQREEICPMAKE